SITIRLADLIVEDQDSPYPSGFTLSILAGQNYSASNATVTPVADFFGKLTIPLTVSDGANTSKPFDLSVSVTPVNDAPRIVNLETTPIPYPGETAVTETLTVKEVDQDSIVFAEVGIRPEGYQMNVDKLVYTPTGNPKIRGVFDPNTGVMTLLGEASPDSYTQAIRSVDYQGPAEGRDIKKVIFIHVSDGVSDSETVERNLVSGKASVALDIPTGFTPNGDLANDTWKIIPLKSEEEFGSARVTVYNKAGAVVYQATGFEKEWDGRLNGELLPADTYFYTIDLKQNAPAGYLRGLVTILR
ncbi:MAG TPA: gliding motility-associated C-terminal domain-containing protein, partial [Chryseosolibacter sp.]